MQSLMGKGAGDIRETAEQSVDTVKLEHYHNELSDSLSTWGKVQNPSPLQTRCVYLTFFRSNKLENTLSRSNHLGEGSSHQRNLDRSLKILVFSDRATFFVHGLTSFLDPMVEFRSMFTFSSIGDYRNFLIKFSTDWYNKCMWCM